MRASNLRKLVGLTFVMVLPGCYTQCLSAKPTATSRQGGEGRGGAVVVLLPPPESLGSVSGRARFAGTPPPRAEIEMSDSACLNPAGPTLEESIEVGAEGGLKNVMVWVSKGLDPAFAWPVPATPASLVQKGCLYVPHVLSMRANQSLKVRNADTITHNVHTRPKLSDEDNWSQGPGQVDLLTTTSKHRTFGQAEDPFKCGCEIHGWMGVWVGVFKHPFHAVTVEDGKFRLDGVPEGKLTLRFWHEKLGTRDVEVEVKRGADIVADAEFRGK
jgi:hypothetical protein